MPQEPIKSKDNARLKAARAARDGRMRSHIFIEGVRLAEEALRSPVNLVECFVDESFGSDGREASLLAAITDRGVETTACTPAAFRSIAGTSNSQGIVLIAERPQQSPGRGKDTALLLYLDHISDPSNLGAVLRTAEAAGVGTVFTSPGSTDAFSPKALRASMGAAFRTRVVESKDFDELIAEVRPSGIMIAGAAANGDVDHYSYDWTRPTLLVIGSEANGLDPSILASIDTRVSIRMAHGVESLNLAVSTGILLFEAMRQRNSRSIANR